ncbi:MAG: hypothetical protein ABSE89_08660 [Sedimentisphaerales bacterium]
MTESENYKLVKSKDPHKKNEVWQPEALSESATIIHPFNKLVKSKNPHNKAKVWRPQTFFEYQALAILIEITKTIKGKSSMEFLALYSVNAFSMALKLVWAIRIFNARSKCRPDGKKVVTVYENGKLFLDREINYEVCYPWVFYCAQLWALWDKMCKIWESCAATTNLYEALKWPEEATTVFSSSGMSALEAMHSFTKNIIDITFSYLDSCENQNLTADLITFEPKEHPIIKKWWEDLQKRFEGILPESTWPLALLQREINLTQTKVMHEFEVARKNQDGKSSTNLTDTEQNKGNAGETKTIAKKLKKPISDKAAAVYELLKTLPEHRGLTGHKIIKELSKQNIFIDQSTLTKNIIPILKKDYNVKNKPRIGYYIAK